MATTDPPLISVCMPVHNAERFVGEAVESILGQTLGDFEFLIIDDGSTDGSTRILTDYAARDRRIRLTCRSNRGLVATLNELVDQARGEFIARMDADDIALPDRFLRQVDYLRSHPECVEVGSWVQVIDPEGDPLCIWFQEQEHEAIDALHLRGDQGAVLCHPSVMIRRSALLAVGKYNGFTTGEDLDLHLRLAERGRLASLPQVLLKYRTHAHNRSKTAFCRQMAARDAWEMIRNARRRRNLPGDPPPSRSAPTSEPSSSDQETWVWWALASGYVGSARKHARRLLARAPFSPHNWKILYCAIRGY